jgi:hypothetical protein
VLVLPAYGRNDTKKADWQLKTSEDLYYWPEFYGPYGTYMGKWVKMINTGGALSMKATANYFCFSYADSSQLLIGSSFTVEDAVRKKATRPHGEYQGLVYIPAFDPDCFRCCCTDSSLDLGWYYAAAKLDTNDVVGVFAHIKTRYGELCGECANSTKHSHHAVFVNFSNEVSSKKWGQTGYIQRRLSGSTIANRGRYAEIKGDYHDIKIDSVSQVPLEGEWHVYEVRLDPATGVIGYSYDYALWHTFPAQTFWLNNKGTSAQWTAEIYGYETDMGAGSNAPCSLNVCKYMSDGGAYQDADFFSTPNFQIGSSDLSKWGIEVLTQTTLKIWDKEQLPVCK